MGRKKETFIVLDTETAPTPKCQGVEALNMRVYDLGWIVTDDSGMVYERRSLAISETFANDEMMESSYYASKLPQYYQGMECGKWQLISFLDAYKLLQADARKYNAKTVWAYNARFDRDTLNATLYDYSNGYRSVFLPFGIKVKDIMQYATNTIVKTKRYAKWAEATGHINGKGKPSRSAESVYRYLVSNTSFIESHTALDDCEIELAILRHCKPRGKHPKAMKSTSYGLYVNKED